MVPATCNQSEFHQIAPQHIQNIKLKHKLIELRVQNKASLLKGKGIENRESYKGRKKEHFV